MDQWDLWRLSFYPDQLPRGLCSSIVPYFGCLYISWCILYPGVRTMRSLSRYRPAVGCRCCTTT